MRKRARTESAPPAAWSSLLANAVAKPGVISEAYRRFWNYSAGNQLLALFQCFERKLEPGPIHTFLGWQELGRHVRKGEKALTLCMPVTVKPRRKAAESESEEDSPRETFTRFLYRPHWFVLAQTEGEPYRPQELPEWSEARALAALSVTRASFRHLDGNAQGYAVRREVAVSPIAFAPHRTLFHELAHVVLGHTEEVGRMDDGEHTPRSLREVEAESVALICCESLGLSGAEYSRGYIQHWLTGEAIPERPAHRIFRAADQILRAGRPQDG
jgi:antirestriction protein ArdC